MANKMSKTQRDKVRILKPIIDHWNEVHDDCWKLVPYIYKYHEYTSTSVDIKRENIQKSDSAHGLLISDIAGIANAYGWTWSMYSDLEHGVYFSL